MANEAKEPKVIVITGVSRGLGRAMLEEFLQRGHFVAGGARSEIALVELREKYPDRGYIVQMNVADPGHTDAFAAEVAKRFGPVDLLINNAAIINKNARLWEIPADEFSAIIEINIQGVANMIRSFVPAMIELGRGVIVNLSSGWGRSTAPEVAPYCATKWAIEGMTQALAQELPAGMAAVPLNPGVIDTKMLRSCFGGSAGAYPKPAEWAKNAVPFLLSLGAKDNGRSLTVPGTPVD